jgi:hypothetical protein
MKKAILIALIMVFSLSLACFAQDLSVPSYVNSPQALVEWFSSDFRYVLTLTGKGSKIQTPQETIKLKTGQCGDFAVLASEILSHLGIANKVIIIKYRGLNIMHAICIWRNEDGTYNFISNQELICSGIKTIEGAAKKFYPDCERIFTQRPDGMIVALNSEAH